MNAVIRSPLAIGASPAHQRPLERGNSVGRATRELLIITAEELFAERGTAAVSLREIGQVAGQRNNAATQYHFGTRDNLIEAIHEYRAEQIDIRRWELLEELDSEGLLGDVRTLLSAMFRPHVEGVLDPENHFLGFLSRRLVDEGTLLFNSAGTAAHMSAQHRFVELIEACAQGLDAATFKRRLYLIITWAIRSLAIFERTVPVPSGRRIENMFSELVDMLAAALLTS